MNLCLTCRDIGPDDQGGLSRSTCDLAQALAREGHDVHLLTELSDAPIPTSVRRRSKGCQSRRRRVDLPARSPRPHLTTSCMPPLYIAQSGGCTSTSAQSTRSSHLCGAPRARSACSTIASQPSSPA